MKKIMLSLAMALVSVCASAQVYIGGTAGISSNKIGDGDSKTAYTLMPEIGYQFNNKWEAGLEIGIKKGEVCKLSPVGESTTFKVAPYVRYTAVETKLVNLFVSFTHSLLTGQQQVLAKLMPDDLRIRRAEELQQNFLKILIGRFSLREEILATDRAKIFPSNPIHCVSPLNSTS